MARVLACALILLPMISGCVAKTAFDVVTAPVRIASKAVDLATTSQSEADEKRGRDIRRREEQLARLDREWRKLADDCGRWGSQGRAASRKTFAPRSMYSCPMIPYEPSRQ